MKKSELENKTVAVVGLGYVGFPLAVEFGKRMPTIGYDLNETKLASYRRCQDPTGGMGEDDLGMGMDEYLKKLERGGCFIDVKSCFNAKTFTDAGMHVWRL